MGVNSRAALAMATRVMRQRIIEGHMANGVTFVDPATAYIDVDVRIGEDTVIGPYTFLHGQVAIGGECQIGPMTTLIDCALGNGVHVFHSYLEACEVLDGCRIGPFQREFCCSG